MLLLASLAQGICHFYLAYSFRQAECVFAPREAAAGHKHISTFPLHLDLQLIVAALWASHKLGALALFHFGVLLLGWARWQQLPFSFIK